ncbi:MAG TPA: hypothetical protein VLH12_08725 [Usitatibacter sp.]|nr:hypothetical protein [Usitatibacter sp.]
MALTKFALQLLAPHLKGARVLAFGYPDLLATRAEAGAILGCRAPLQKTNPHGAAHKAKTEMAETVEAFTSAGAAALVCLDVTPSRGVETKHDLNYPLAASIATDRWDLVIDAGTIEHCANIGQALMNAADAVAPGGRVFHSPPISMVNHGFYNVCPTLLVDFYEQNGWLVEHMSAFSARDFVRYDIPRMARVHAPPESALYFLACRGPRATAAPRWPTQAKYLK